MTDVTKKFRDMIERFDNDFSLASNSGNDHGLDELQCKIENGNEQIIRDIKLLNELAFKLRREQIKIKEYRNRMEITRDMTGTEKLLADLKHHADAFETGVAFTDVSAMSTSKVLRQAIECIEKGYVNEETDRTR